VNADRLNSRAKALGETRAAQVGDGLMTTDIPEGVRLERTKNGVCLIGKNLRRRMLDDAKLRSFGR
jgi:hypothetical protein